MAERRSARRLIPIDQPAQEATVHTQLNYLIAQQHHADMIRTAKRHRLAAQTAASGPARPAAPLRRLRQWITAASAPTTPSDIGGARQKLAR
jgi:hypothetical protein